MTEGDVCPSCGEARPGLYCGACGEKRIEARDLTVGSFVGQLAEEFASLDAKLPRSVWQLVRRPGALTVAWLGGLRSRYVRPFQLFLLANLVYFVVQPFTGYHGYNTTLRSQMDSQFYSGPLAIADRVRAEVARSGVSSEAWTAAYDAKSEILAKTLVLVLVPLFALAVALVFGRRGRPLVQHLVFALHYYAFELIFISSLFLLLWSPTLHWLDVRLGLAAARTASPAGAALFTLLHEFPTVPLILAWLYLAARRVYGSGRLASMAAALFFIAAQFAGVLLYRLILFRVTLLAL